jgi:hypothetical protein
MSKASGICCSRRGSPSWWYTGILGNKSELFSFFVIVDRQSASRVKCPRCVEGGEWEDVLETYLLLFPSLDASTFVSQSTGYRIDDRSSLLSITTRA